MKSYLSEQIYLARTRKGITQRELAELVHVEYRTISDWERKKTSPPWEMILRLCDALGITPNVLVEKPSEKVPLRGRGRPVGS